MGIKEWRYSSLHLFPEAVWRGQAFSAVGVARGDDPNVRSLHSLNTQALDQGTNEWIMGKSDYRMRGLTDVQGIMGYQSRPVITLLDIKGLDEWAFNCSVLDALCCCSEEHDKRRTFYTLLLNYSSLWPCCTSACLIISVTVVDDLRFRAEFYDFIFYFIYSSIAKKIWVNVFDIPEVWKQKLQPQKYRVICYQKWNLYVRTTFFPIYNSLIICHILLSYGDWKPTW